MSLDELTTWKVSKYGRKSGKGWEMIHDGTGPISLVLQPKMSILVLQNASVLESVPLFADPGMIQVIVKDGLLMFVINDRKPPRKFKVLFAQEKPPQNPRQPLWDCLSVLRMYYPITDSSDPSTGCNASIQGTTLTEIFKKVMTEKGAYGRDLGQVSINISPTGPALDNVVRLCLFDTTFPAFAGSVEKSLQSLTGLKNPINR